VNGIERAEQQRTGLTKEARARAHEDRVVHLDDRETGHVVKETPKYKITLIRVELALSTAPRQRRSYLREDERRNGDAALGGF
jgi:hypothetical protein